MFRSFVSRLVTSPLLTNVHKVNHSLANTFATDRPIIEKGINQVTLLGRLGTDPVRKGSEARPVVLFSMATHLHFKTGGNGWPNWTLSDIHFFSDEFQQKTDWHRISVFRNRLMDKTLNYAQKGTRVLVQGRLSYGQVTDVNGLTHQTTSIIADDIIFLSKSRSSDEAEADSDSDEALEN